MCLFASSLSEVRQVGHGGCSLFLLTLACNVGSLGQEYGPCCSDSVPFCYKDSPPGCVEGEYKEKGGNIELSGNIVKGKCLKVAAV